jgi:hypothetical protein
MSSLLQRSAYVCSRSFLRPLTSYTAVQGAGAARAHHAGHHARAGSAGVCGLPQAPAAYGIHLHPHARSAGAFTHESLARGMPSR